MFSGVQFFLRQKRKKIERPKNIFLGTILTQSGKE
jgi:hypothetical protein